VLVVWAVLVVDGVATGVESVGMGAAVAVGVGVAASAMTGEGANTRAAETTRATEIVGYANAARTRTWRAMSLFLYFTGSSLCLLIVEKGHRVVR
jgi:type IV secretory pathway TrbL component